MTAKSPEPHAFGPVTWDEIDDPFIYDSGTILKPFNDALNLKSGLLRMSVARLLPGEDVDHHDHYTMAEVYFLMRGKGQFRVNDQLIDAEQGTGMYFEPGGAAGRDQFHVECDQGAGEIHEAGLVGNAEQGTADGESGCWIHTGVHCLNERELAETANSAIDAQRVSASDTGPKYRS